jgi:hypothetical protein
MRKRYEPPELICYGTLAELTAATLPATLLVDALTNPV